MTDPAIDPGARPPRRRMSGWMKWTAIGCGGLLLLVVIAALVARVWWGQNRERLRAGMDAVADSGGAYAATGDQAACVAEGFRRAEDGGGLRGSLANRLFVDACLEAAAPSPGLCEGVPPANRVMESARWQRVECGDNQVCIGAVQALQEFCAAGGHLDTGATGDIPQP